MSTPKAALLRRHAGLGTVAAVALATVLLAGCGERYGPGSEGPKDPSTAQAAEAPPLPPPTTPAATTVATTPTTPPTTPGTTPGGTSDPRLGEVENLGGVIWQPKAVYDGPVQLSVRDGYVAAVVPNGEVGQLRVSSGGEAPVPAEGAGAVPAWGRPHVGTDLSGRTVVTYPRCVDPEAVGTCDIYQWTAKTKREVVLRGVSGTALAETEAVMDFGTTLVVREKRPVLSANDLQFDTPPLTTLLIKERDKPLKVVTRHGGRQVDLRGSRIADVFVVPGSSSPDCADTAARALNLDGLTVASRVVKCTSGQAKSEFSVASGPSVADNHLRFSVTQPGEPGTALDHDLSTGRTREAKLTMPLDWWTADGKRSGYGLNTVDGAGKCAHAPLKASDLPPNAPCRIVRSAKLVWKPVTTDWKLAAGETPVRD